MGFCDLNLGKVWVRWLCSGRMMFRKWGSSLIGIFFFFLEQKCRTLIYLFILILYFILFIYYFFPFILISWRLITLQYYSGFCHTLTWISHGFTCVSHPDPLSHLPPYPIPLGHPSAPASSTLSHASNLDWWSILHMIIYMFQCHSPKSSHPRLLSWSPKDCSIHLCLFCCLAYRVIWLVS